MARAFDDVATALSSSDEISDSEEALLKWRKAIRDQVEEVGSMIWEYSSASTECVLYWCVILKCAGLLCSSALAGVMGSMGWPCPLAALLAMECHCVQQLRP